MARLGGRHPNDEPRWLVVVVVVGVCWRGKTDDELMWLVVVVVGVCWQERMSDEPRYLGSSWWWWVCVGRKEHIL
jgi:hypothetical protein